MGIAPLQGQRNGVEDGFTDIGQRKNNKNDAFHKNGQQCDLPTVAETLHHGVGQVGIQAHARRQDEGQIRYERHAAGGEEGSNGSCQKHGRRIHAGIGQNTGVDSQDVRHGHEGGNARHDLRFNGGFVLRQLEKSFRHLFTTFHMLFLRCADAILLPFFPNYKTPWESLEYLLICGQ